MEFLYQIYVRRKLVDLAVVMSTHLTDEAARMERVVMLHQSRVVADDAPAALRRQLGARRVTVHDASWSPTDNADRWRRISDEWALDLMRHDEAEDIASMLAKGGVAFTIAPPTLDDVFERLTGARLGPDAITDEGAA